MLFSDDRESGQVRAYVRPPSRRPSPPLATMGVRLRVGHQTAARALGTSVLPVSPDLPRRQTSPSRGMAPPAGSAGLAPGVRVRPRVRARYAAAIISGA